MKVRKVFDRFHAQMSHKCWPLPHGPLLYTLLSSLTTSYNNNRASLTHNFLMLTILPYCPHAHILKKVIIFSHKACDKDEYGLALQTSLGRGILYY